MFGAPPVGHVMDPQLQFKPTPFFGGLWKYVCKCKYVVSTQLVAWKKDTSRICMYVMYVRITMNFGGAIIYQWKT